MLLKRPEITQSDPAYLRVLGGRTAIDDFGTGFSALNRLRRFAVDTLMGDQSFVREIAEATARSYPGGCQ
jgi:EAL domain-containing protein (putative c-di-GMP-specific phosphodiesterase class I)